MLDIIFDKEITSLSTPNAKAFEIKGKSNYFCLICNKSYMPRYSILKNLQNFKGNLLLTPIDMVSVNVPYDNDNSKKVGFIFKKPNIGKLALNNQISFKDIKSIVIPSFIATMSELEALGISHRAIRTDNVFFSLEDKKFIFGECISAPPGMNNPAVFEEVDRQLCNPFLRGNGNTASDCYSFGVLLVAMLNGSVPHINTSYFDLANMKSEKGSFVTLMMFNALSNYAGKEILQGLLHDDPKIRWGIDDVREWLQGFSKIKNFVHRSNKTTPLKIFNQKIVSVKQFIIFVIKNWKKCEEGIEVKKIKDWVNKNFSDKIFSEKINLLFHTAGHLVTSKNGLNGFMLSSICCYINAGGPIIWNNLVFMPDAINYLIIYCLFEVNFQKDLKEIARIKLLSYLTNNVFDIKNLKNTVEIFEQELISNVSGLEYCLYEFNESLPCMSPLLRNSVVFNPENLLAALEENSEFLNRLELIDSHIVTFVYKVLKNDKTFSTYGINNISTDINQQLKILISIEEISKIKTHPNLTMKILDICSDFIDEYKNKNTRKELKAMLDAPSTKKLTFKAIYDLINNISLLNKDRKDFQNAKKKYKMLDQQIKKIELYYLKNNLVSRYFADKVAVFVCSFLASMIIFFIIKNQLFNVLL